jgi:hypothetical protein
MKLKSGIEISNSWKMTDYGGQHGYLFWVEDQFAPPVFFVRGDNFSEAYENFLCHPLVEAWQEITDPTEYGFADWEAFRIAFENSDVAGVEYNDNGKLLDTESINGRPMGAHD